MSNQSRTLYVGVTNNVKARVWQHKTKIVEGFTSHYNIGLLVYVESFCGVWSAIAREKQIKRWMVRLMATQTGDSGYPAFVTLAPSGLARALTRR